MEDVTLFSRLPYYRLEYYMKGDIVACQGDPPQGMYFVGEGHLEVRSYEVNDQQDSVLLLAASTEADLEGWPFVLRGKLRPPGEVADFKIRSKYC